MKKLLFTLLFIVPLFAIAQFNQGGTLNIFSEDGEKFTLILNGEKQNDEPQTNIRIEELPQPYYNAKVIFEDKTLAPITKNSLMIVDADGKFMDVTYKIRKDKQNKMKMNYFSMIPVRQDFIPPSNMYVHRYGQPFGDVSVGTTRTTTRTTTTNTVGANVNVGGMNMSVTIQDPDADFGSSHTTTTTTHHQSGGTQQPRTYPRDEPRDYPRDEPRQRRCSGNWPMNSSNFMDAKKTIEEGSFDDTKLSTAKSIVTANCLSTEQVIQICKLFSFEENKLAFAQFAFAYVTDPKNYFKVNNVFSFSSSKEELNSFIQGNN